MTGHSGGFRRRATRDEFAAETLQGQRTSALKLIPAKRCRNLSFAPGPSRVTVLAYRTTSKTASPA
jgi:hypothetical protein